MANVVIIGGGVSGLSAGIYTQLGGHHAIVCERHAVAGGNLTGWDRGGYHIDNCIHWLTGTNPASDAYQTWVDLGALDSSTEVHQAEALYTCERDGKQISLYRDLDRLEREMIALSPRDTRAIRSFCKTVRDIQGHVGIGGKNNDQPLTPSAKLASLPGIIKHHWMSTGEFAARLHHPLLQDFVISLVGTEFSVFALAVIVATFCGKNGAIPKGSSCAMLERITKRLLELGGELHLRKEAVSIQHENGRAKSVTFSDGSIIAADYVIIATDPIVAYRKLLSMELPTQLKKKYEQDSKYRFSSYHCAFACDTKELPFKGDFIFEIPQEYRERLRTRYLVIREFSHEESFAPEGKSLLQTLTLCDEKTAREFVELRADKAAYTERKRAIANDVLTLITNQFPSLAGKLTVLDVWTPATYKRYIDSDIGSWMSFIFTPRTLPKKLDNRVKPLKNAVFATQWLNSPGGLPIAGSEGKRAAQSLLEIIAKDQKN